MQKDKGLERAQDIMLAFADWTGIGNSDQAPRRYLWTDAFAVCNYLTLYRRTGDQQFMRLATDLVDQVHEVLGKFRADDPRSGWISGLGEQEGQRHPTAGGLRIGKKLPERQPGEPYDDKLEWDRDGQYFHYLTKWMHALQRAGAVTRETVYCRWAIELAKSAQAHFAYATLDKGPKRMYWKMSTDLSQPLIPSMGLHDPLDALVTYNELRYCSSAASDGSNFLDLGPEIRDAAQMCENRDWSTDDTLGIGGLLFDASRLLQLADKVEDARAQLAASLLETARKGVDNAIASNTFRAPAQYRLGFRELGLAIGLEAVPKLTALIRNLPATAESDLSKTPEDMSRFVPLAEAITAFWQAPPNQQTASWQEHLDINEVMLATSMAPDEFLSV